MMMMMMMMMMMELVLMSAMMTMAAVVMVMPSSQLDILCYDRLCCAPLALVLSATSTKRCSLFHFC